MDYPKWLEIFLAICMGMALAGLGAWMFYNFAVKLLHAAAALEDKRANKETEALNTWKASYDAERAAHLSDVSDLTNKIFMLEKEIKIKNAVLAKARVSDL